MIESNNDDGKTVRYKKNWNKDTLVDVTEFYMNGKKSRIETYKSKDKRFVETFYDDGKPYDSCEEVQNIETRWGYSYPVWVRDKLYKYWSYDNEKHLLNEETNYKEGKLEGLAKLYDAKTGELRYEFDYKDNNKVEQREFENSKLKTTTRFHKDGSRAQ